MSVFLHFVFFDSIKVLKILLIVSRQRITSPVSVFWLSSHTWDSWFFPVNSLLQFITCSSLTPRSWFTEALRCINDLVHSEFPISALPCCSVFIMISSDLSYRDRITFTGKWCFFTILDREKCSTFLHQRHLRYK